MKNHHYSSKYLIDQNLDDCSSQSKKKKWKGKKRKHQIEQFHLLVEQILQCYKFPCYFNGSKNRCLGWFEILN